MGLFRTVRSPVSFDGERALEVRPPPTLDEHGEEIRRELAARRKAPHRSTGMTLAPIARRRPPRRPARAACSSLVAGPAHRPGGHGQDGRAVRPGHHHRHRRAGSSPRAWARRCGQTVVVDNRAGAGGSHRHRPGGQGRGRRQDAGDGHGRHARDQRRRCSSKLPYDPMRDFAPVAFVGYTPTLLVVAAGSPLKSLKDLATLAARPEGVTFASAGNGTSGHLAGELLAQRLGGKMIHVPYKEGAVALTERDGGPGRLHVLSPGRGDAADQGRQAARPRRAAARCAAPPRPRCRR